MNNQIIQTPNSFLTKFNLQDIDDCDIDEKLLADCIEYVDGLLDIKPPIKIFDKIVNQRRDVGFFSSTSVGYYFSGQLAKSKPMNTSLNILLQAINKMFSSEFNGILINRYNSGDEYIGPHSDDEKYLDKSGVVAISCGGKRIFRIRNKYTKKLFQDIPIKNMDVIHMGGNFQKEFTHEIPQTKKSVGLRYSFTFRHHNM